MRIIHEKNAASNSELLPLIHEKRKIYLDRITEIGYLDESDFIKFLDYWEIEKQEMKDDSFKVIYEKWEKEYGEKSKMLTDLYWNRKHLSDMNEILQSMG